MFSLNNLKPADGARKASKRLGRGNGSGKGTFSGKGCKGQKARSGGNIPAWFEGGQTPLFRRMPKLKGFSNALFKKEYNIVNISDLEKICTKGISTIDKQVLIDNNLIGKKNLPIKVLGDGELKSKLLLKVERVSRSAKEAIEKAGGSIEILS
ncbi:50S ribosomal protein L15 [Candidatus Gracilibacteria bacterium]|nr:50S ribosomal protein L15 [Candidatus Gracilibacteria bacterium]NUJ98613.1 50S ribosomal protein L15 [Candidatus Gracilibacteria bacterium]